MDWFFVCRPPNGITQVIPYYHLARTSTSVLVSLFLNDQGIDISPRKDNCSNSRRLSSL